MGRRKKGVSPMGSPCGLVCHDMHHAAVYGVDGGPPGGGGRLLEAVAGRGLLLQSAKEVAAHPTNSLLGCLIWSFACGQELACIPSGGAWLWFGKGFLLVFFVVVVGRGFQRAWATVYDFG